jgi:hypothetical protein
MKILIIFLSILIPLFIVTGVVILVFEIISRIRSYNGWKKIKHDTGTFYLTLQKTSNGKYDIDISRVPIYFFRINYNKRDISQRSIRLSKFEQDDEILEYLKKSVDMTIQEYNLSKNKKNIVKNWDGNVLSKKGQRKENLNKIIP